MRGPCVFFGISYKGLVHPWVWVSGRVAGPASDVSQSTAIL